MPQGRFQQHLYTSLSPFAQPVVRCLAGGGLGFALNPGKGRACSNRHRAVCNLQQERYSDLGLKLEKTKSHRSKIPILKQFTESKARFQQPNNSSKCSVVLKTRPIYSSTSRKPYLQAADLNLLSVWAFPTEPLKSGKVEPFFQVSCHLFLHLVGSVGWAGAKWKIHSCRLLVAYIQNVAFSIHTRPLQLYFGKKIKPFPTLPGKCQTKLTST